MRTVVSRTLSRPLAILLSLLLALAGVVVLAPPASAATGDVTGGSATWGIDATYRSVFATRSTSGGASIAAGDLPTWPVDATSSSYDADSRTGTIRLTGSVRLGYMTGAPVPGTTDGNYVHLANPVITLSGDTGTLSATSAGASHGLNPELPLAPLASRTIATLDLSGVAPVAADGTLTWSAVPTAIAAGGAEVLAFYASAEDTPHKREVGSALDALTFSLALEQAPVVTATTTVLTASPASTAEEGETVTLTATVSPAATGTVQFFDGSAPLGAPVEVAAGTAVLAADALAAGSHSLSAQFTSTDAAFGSSTSSAVAYEITAAGGGGVTPSVPRPDSAVDIDDASLVWGYSGYAQTGIFGAWRFFGATGDATITTGSATGYAPAPFPATSLPATVTDPNVVAYSAGEGWIDEESGAAFLSYDGAFTVNPYPAAFGAPDETYGDPIVAVQADGSGSVSFEMSLAAGTDMSGNPTPAVDLGRVVLATFTATDAGATGFTITPAFAGIVYDPPAGESPQVRECATGWGAWPAAFVDALAASVRAHYYSTGCGGMQDRKPALPLAISYTEAPVTPVPTVTVSKTEDLEPGDVITVTGSGFVQDASGQPLAVRPPIAGKFGGVYVVFGTFADDWKPSEGAASTARKGAPGQTRWFVNAEDVATIGGADRGGAAIGPDGTFSVELTVTDEFEGALADGNFGVYTYAGGGAVHARFETSTPIAFATEPTTPTEPVDPVASPGSLTWGVKASFRSYVTGPIAHGSITTAGGAGPTSGGYWFPQSTASASGDSAGYRGSVTFAGHAGALNLRLADPTVRLTGANTGILSVVADGSRVDFATLALGTPTTDATGARTWTGAAATLTSDGAASFAGFYAAGTALDPVTFTIGSPNATSGRGSTLAAGPATTRTPAATPPATEGIGSDATAFVEGGEYTFTADGFLPGETGILAVIYSTPTVLADDLTADAAGAVTWTGRLPAGLTGEHTLTFQGSVDRGIVLDIAAAETVGCTVEGAVLDWGFKESFRAYIDGSIANGEWTTADGATYETPLFTWADGAGGYDAETGDADLRFTGSVRFTGHGGILDTTIANPRLVIDGDRAVLFLDVTGTTQAGEVVAATGVEFAELDLADAAEAGGGDVVAFTGIPAVLTAAGAAAFGTYPEGEALDPVDLRITIDPMCAEPAVAPEAAATGAEVEPVSDVAAWPWIVLALALAAVVAVAVVILVRRSRRAA